MKLLIQKMNIMKKFIKNIGLLFLMVLVLGSCSKWIDPDLNINPDEPDEVTMVTLMPVIQARMAFTIVGGNDMTRTQSIWLQHLCGVSRQSMSEGNYQLRAGDVNNLFNATYAGSMMDIVKLQNYAEAADPVAYHYRGAGNILMALALGLSTDVWNAIPYTEAFQGEANITPKYDSQADLYVTVKTLLHNGIADLQKTDESGLPLDGDYFFGGDVDAWIRAANSLLARYTLHLSKQDGSAWAEALTFLNAGISSNDEDMQFNYGTAATNSNPFYQFMRDRGDVRMGSYFIDTLKARFDPRLPVFAELAACGEYVGAVMEAPSDTASAPGVAIAAPDAPTYLVTYQEMLFIKAECQYKTGVDEATVKATLVEALSASLEKYGVYEQVYIDGYALALAAISGNALYDEIFFQKYVALIYQAETWVDWRRSENVIGLVRNQNGETDEIPRRFPYPTDEVTYNAQPEQDGVTITDRVWWDGN